MEEYLSHSGARLSEASYQDVQSNFWTKCVTPNHFTETVESGTIVFRCEFPRCEKTFIIISEYQRHFATHDDKRRYYCPYSEICNKAFKRSDALKAHVRLHTGEKPFICPVGSCEFSFSTKAGLRYHVLKHKNDKIYQCDFPGTFHLFISYL